jgi:hypothetical protein
LASAFECASIPETFDELSQTAMRAVGKGAGGIVTAGATSAGIACAIDLRFAELGI